jgi:hypothetical protein
MESESYKSIPGSHELDLPARPAKVAMNPEVDRRMKAHPSGVIRGGPERHLKWLTETYTDPFERIAWLERYYPEYVEKILAREYPH